MAWHDESKQLFEFEFDSLEDNSDHGIAGFNDGKACIIFTREGLEKWVKEAGDLLDNFPGK